jgi:gliding motility-associated-like protein
MMVAFCIFDKKAKMVKCLILTALILYIQLFIEIRKYFPYFYLISSAPKVKKKLFLILSLCSFTAYGQGFFGNSFGGTQVDEALAVDIDPSSQASVTTGYFASAANFNGTNLVALGICDIFLTKHSASGNFLWVKQLGGGGMERATSVSIDAGGNIFITGFFEGNFVFDGITYSSIGQEDVFVAKLDPAGNPLWFVQEGGAASDLAHSVKVDVNGDVIVTGQFRGTADFGGNILTGIQEDIFIAKYNGANGTLLWIQQGTAGYSDRGIAVCTDENANVYVTGEFSDTITFDIQHNYNLFNSIFVIKLDPNGNEQWFRVIAGGLTNFSYDIESDYSGHIYLTGDFTGTLQFLSPIDQTLTNPYTHKVFLAKMSSAGGLVWARADGSESEVTSRSVDVQGSQVMFAGNFKCTFDEYSAMYGTGTFNSVGFWDCYLTSYDANSGTRQWARQWAGPKDDKCNSLAIDNTGIPLTAGSMADQLNIPKPIGSNPSLFGPLAICTGSPNPGYCSAIDYDQYYKLGFAGTTDIFTGKFVDVNRLPYDYYFRNGTGCTRPDLPVCIFGGTFTGYGDCSPDSLEFCDAVYLWANTFTIPNSSYGTGPNYTYLWSNGESLSQTLINTTGNVSVTITSDDGCYSSTDQIYVIIHPLPPVPLISDDVIINTLALNADTIQLCAPDTALLTGTLQGSPSMYSNYYWDMSFPSSNNLQVGNTGHYEFTVTDTNGCSNLNFVNVIIHQPIQSILPAMECINDTDHNDSIEICMGDPVYISIFDQITSINCIPYLSGSCYCNGNLFVTFNSNDLGYPCAGFPLIPTNDTLYGIECHLLQVNICDTFSYDISDSLFVVVHTLPDPQVNLSSSGSLCSGDTVLVTATGNGTVVWEFSPSLPWEFNGVDSAWINQPIIVSVSVTITDTNGCYATANNYQLFDYPIPPNIIIVPSDGLICPGDSVEISIPLGVYTSYQWFGPGSSSSSTSTIYASESGFFYCTVTDTNGCEVTSDIVEISQYTVPNLFVAPDNILCDTNESATISVFSSADGLFNWINPAAGNAPSVNVNQPGIYLCEFTLCGTTIYDSVQIFIDTNHVLIYTTDSAISCLNTSVVLNASTGFTNYIWNPDSVLGTSITVTSPGSYFVTATDALGCTITSNDMNVIVDPETIEPPDTASVVFCNPDSVILSAFGSGIVSWFDSFTSTNPLYIGSTYQTPVLAGTTIYYVTNSIDSCASARIPVYAIAINCDTVVITGDTLVMPNVFTPNGDGSNDFIGFDLNGISCFNVFIYDRWGISVFESKDPSNKWYGTNKAGDPLSDGVYFYVVEYCTANTPLKVLKGFIHLFN